MGRFCPRKLKCDQKMDGNKKGKVQNLGLVDKYACGYGVLS